MKIKIFIFFLVAFIWALLPSRLLAQNDNLSVVAVPYETEQDLEYLHTNSVHPIDAIKSEHELDNPIFVGMVTVDQMTEIESNGYLFDVIDQKAGDITQYYLFEGEYYPQFPTDAGFEMVHPLTPSLTLVKVPADKTIEDLRQGGLMKYFIQQYTFDMKLMPTSEMSATEPTSMAYELEEESNNIAQFMTWSILIALLIGIVVFFIYRKKKSKENQNLPQ